MFVMGLNGSMNFHLTCLSIALYLYQDNGKMITALCNDEPIQSRVESQFKCDLMMIFWCFISLSTLFKSYLDNEGVIMKCVIQSGANVSPGLQWDLNPWPRDPKSGTLTTQVWFESSSLISNVRSTNPSAKWMLQWIKESISKSNKFPVQ